MTIPWIYGDGAPPAPGAYSGVPDPVYRSWPGYSKSMVAQARGAYPAEWPWRLAHPQPPSDAMLLGSAVDALLLGPGTLDDFLVRPAGLKLSTKAGMQWADVHAADTRPQLTADQAQTAMDCAAAVRAHDLASLLLGASERQVAAWWHRGGHVRKGLIDGLVTRNSPLWAEVMSRFQELDYAGIVWDLKTMGPDRFSGKPRDLHGITSESSKWGYHLQLAHYRDGVEQTIDPGVWICLLVIVGTGTYHPVEVLQMTEPALVAGLEEIDGLIDLHDRCKRAGVWPSSQTTQQPMPIVYNRYQLGED